jgi:hypothetical protein
MSTAAAIAATEHSTTPKQPPELAEALRLFLRYLEGQNRSEATIGAYRADLTQFLAWLAENNMLGVLLRQELGDRAAPADPRRPNDPLPEGAVVMVYVRPAPPS